VFADKPVIILVKLPVPVVVIVLLSATVGVWFVLQQTPQAVIPALPLLVISPPQVAVVWVIYNTSVVVITGLLSLLQLIVSIIDNPVKRNR
jgi:hypothetical protein